MKIKTPAVLSFERRAQLLELRAKVLQAEQERIEGKETVSIPEARKRLKERIQGAVARNTTPYRI